MTLRIGHKLLLATLVTSLLAVTLACVAFLGYERTSLQRAMESDLQVLADVVGDHGTAALTFGDRDGATGGLAALQAHPHVTGAVLFDAQGRPFASYQREGADSPANPERKPTAALDWQSDGLAVTRLVMLDGAPIGSVYLRADLGELRERMRHQTEVMGFAMLAAAILALVLGALLQWRIARRIRQLSDLSRDLHEAYGGEPLRGRDEIARVASGLRTLYQRLAATPPSPATAPPTATDDARVATLERERDEARDAARRSREYLAFMSHELRTPLTGMTGMTDLVLEGTLAPEQREYLMHARGSADQLMALVNDVLDLSKLEAERVELEYAPFALRDTLESAMHTITPRAHGKGLELLVHLADDLPDTVLGDALRLRQVLVNLLGNAVKFTADGSITLTVAGAPAADGTLELQVDVRDTGIGIAPEHLERLFEPYTQAERSTAREYGGTGLGLNIGRRLIELMGGHLWADSMPGEGSTFHFTLRLGTTVATHALPPALPVRGGAALVVDDHEGARSTLAAELQSLGLHVTTATDGPAALAELAQAEAAGSHFDLVFVDHTLPGLDGVRLLEALRAHPQVPAVTVLMVSPGSPLGEPSHESLAGIAARVSKPLLPATIRSVVEQVLGSATITTATPEVPTRALEVLVAEDDPVNRKLAVTLLRKHGHRVTVANDGREACAWLDRRAFDLVLMDMHMPDVDGFAATEAIRTHEAETGARRTPIIALTALATDADRDRCLAVGMDGHAHKPLRMAELMERFGHLLEPAPATLAPPTPQPTTAVTPEASVRPLSYDRAQLERNVDGDLSLMRELVDAFVVSHGEQVNALQSALSERRVAEALRAAHSLKGMLLTLAASEAAQVAYDMELSLRSHEVEHAVARMPELAVELERLVLDLGGDERRAA